MKRWKSALCVCLLALLCVNAVEVQLNGSPGDQEQCSGMYSQKAWGGTQSPFILAKFVKYVPTTGSDNANHDPPKISFIMFEWADQHLIGIPTSMPGKKNYICTADAVKSGFCSQEELGTWLLQPNATRLSHNAIITQSIDLTNPPPINYPILNTGYYCVSTSTSVDIKYTVIVEFRNAYGELSGAQIPKLPFYGGLSIVYAVILAFWVFLYVQNRQDILPVQNYITATLVFLVVEMAATWAYYDWMNRNGNDFGSKVIMIVVSILNAARNSFSFFLLLIVCMGYGVVKHSLGRTMIIVRWLAIAHFGFGVIYAIASLTITPESAGPLVLLVVLPLAGTLTAFYVWTLNSLSATMKDLAERRQTVKAAMYNKLWWCIFASILTIFGFFFVNSFTFAGQGSSDFAPTHWQSRWFVLDGWLNLVYLFDVCFIAYLWRPTANNRRFAMSDELAQDDEGFEIASVRESTDDEDPERGPPAYDPDRTAHVTDAKDLAVNRAISPLPAPIPQHPPATVREPRESLDGETIFAVGEDGDKFSDSDDEGDYEERKGLTTRDT